MTIETIATFSNGVWTRPVPGYSRPHVPGGNITLTPADRVVATNCLFGDENTLEYVAWKAKGAAIPAQPELVKILWNNGYNWSGESGWMLPDEVESFIAERKKIHKIVYYKLTKQPGILPSDPIRAQLLAALKATVVALQLSTDSFPKTLAQAQDAIASAEKPQ